MTAQRPTLLSMQVSLAPWALAVMCPIVLLAQTPVNVGNSSPKPVPALLTSRTVLADALVGDSMDGYAGYILTVYGSRGADGRCDQGGAKSADVSLRAYVKQGAKIPVKATKFVAFNSLIDRTTALGVKLFVFAATMSADDRTEVIVVDVAEQSIDQDAIDIPTVTALAAQGLPTGACGRFFIRKAILTEVTSKRFTKVQKGSGASGMVFSVDGNVYSSNESFQIDPYLTIEARDIIDFAPTASKTLNGRGAMSLPGGNSTPSGLGTSGVALAGTMIKILSKKK